MERDPERKRLSPILLAILAQAAIAWVTVSTPLFNGRMKLDDLLDDVDIYGEYGAEILRGSIPYRDFPLEYPPGALPFFVLPAAIASLWRSAHPRVFVAAFGVEMMLVMALLNVLIARWASKAESPRALAWTTAYFAVLCPLVLVRFDVVPTLMMFGSVMLWSRGRAALGGALAAIGVLTKIVPGVVGVPCVVRDLYHAKPIRLRGQFAFLATLGIGIAGWYAVAGRGLAASLQYHTERGLEIGSLWTGLLMVWCKLTGAWMQTGYNHSSTEFECSGAYIFAKAAFPLQTLAVLLVAAREARRPSRDPMRPALAAVLAFIAFGKVLSPQYPIWPLPFFAVLRGRWSAQLRSMYLGCCVATIVIYPWGIHRVISLDPLGILALNLRNLAIVALWAILVFDRDSAQSETGGET